MDRSAGPISASDGLSGVFDRDSDADLVTSRFTQFGYRLNTGGSFGPEIRIAAVAAGSNGRSVALGDADGDGDLDAYALVTNIPAATDPPDFIYRNDGLRFTPVPVPSAGGAGDAVTALDGNGDGRTEFLLLNGAGKAGVSQGIQLVFLLASSTRREVYAEYFNDSANLATIPSWATVRGDTFQYIETYDISTGALAFREWYDLAADPYMLRNLLADGDPGNDPATGAVATRLAGYRTCAGTKCPR